MVLNLGCSLGFLLEIWGHCGLICNHVYRESLKFATSAGDIYFILFFFPAFQKVIVILGCTLSEAFRPRLSFHTPIARAQELCLIHHRYIRIR